MGNIYSHSIQIYFYTFSKIEANETVDEYEIPLNPQPEEGIITVIT